MKRGLLLFLYNIMIIINVQILPYRVLLRNTFLYVQKATTTTTEFQCCIRTISTHMRLQNWHKYDNQTSFKLKTQKTKTFIHTKG